VAHDLGTTHRAGSLVAHRIDRRGGALAWFLQAHGHVNSHTQIERQPPFGQIRSASPRHCRRRRCKVAHGVGQLGWVNASLPDLTFTLTQCPARSFALRRRPLRISVASAFPCLPDQPVRAEPVVQESCAGDLECDAWTCFAKAVRRTWTRVAPLAVRMRPRSLEEFVGAAALPGARQSCCGGCWKRDRLTSVIFLRPAPATGKTTASRKLNRDVHQEPLRAGSTPPPWA